MKERMKEERRKIERGGSLKEGREGEKGDRERKR